MKRLLTIATITALTSAFAAEVTWNGDGAYALGADDTMTFSENATITAASAFTGSGTIIVSDGTLTLNYKISETPFSGFTGAIRIDGGATVDENSSQGFAEDGTYSTSVFGPSATIIFNGGTLRGFKGQNNSQITGPVEVRSDSTFQNDRSNSGSGVNLRFRSTVSFTGDKTLTINSNDRWVEFANGVDFSAFTGGIVLNGNSTQEAALYGTNYGESASWTFDANRDFRIAPGTGNTVKFGAIDAQNGRIKLDGNNVTVEVGSKTDSAISVPFTNKAFTLKKVGAGTSLVLSSEATLLDGSSINVAEGTLEIDGQDLSAITVTFAADSTLKLDSTSKATIGTAFGKLDFASGAKLSFSASGLASGEHALFTYNNENPIASVSDVVEVTGISANASVQISDDNGTVKATIDIPTLVWNGEQTNWTDANAWTVGETKCTFCEGDKVSFAGNADVVISGQIAPGSIENTGTLTISGNGTIATSIIGSGSTTISGTDTIRLLGTLEQPICINENATVSIAEQTLTDVDKANPPKITGRGTLLLDSGKVTVAHREGTAGTKIYNLFYDFEGDIKLAEGGFMDYKPVSSDGSSPEEIVGAFGKGKIIFAGGALRGFCGDGKVRNNISITNDIVVLDGTSSAVTNNSARSASYCNMNFSGKFTGKGCLEVWHGWNSSRSADFTGDLSEFEGTINNIGGGFNKIKSSRSSGDKMTLNMNQQDHLMLEHEANSTLKIGAINYPRNSAYISVSSDGTTVEIGGLGEDCAIECGFTNKAFAMKKTGDATLTLGAAVTMVDGSSISVDEGTLKVNSNGLAAPITVAQGAILAGTGTLSSVTFASGAKVGFDGLTDTPEPGDIVEGIVVGSLDGATPAIANAPVCTKGKWKLRTKSVEAGTQFYAEFVKRGFCVIVQ